MNMADALLADPHQRSSIMKYLQCIKMVKVCCKACYSNMF
jgi:hypothetical protein